MNYLEGHGYVDFGSLTAADQNRLLIKEIVKSLVKERNRLGISSYAWSNLSGISTSAISMIESGKREPSLHTLLMLSQGLEIRLGDLINELQQ